MGSYIPPSRRTPCVGCGKTIARTPSSATTPRCMQCRRALPKIGPQSPCMDCGTPSYGKRCRPCSDAHHHPLTRSLDDPRVTRRQRERDAPGLSVTHRGHLLAKWKKQRRTCAYCPSLATTIDHVVPLVRGGTNHEGNLVPCCRKCNGSKGGRTIIEWRTGKRLAPMTSCLSWPKAADRKRTKRVRNSVQLLLTECTGGCGAMTANKRCGDPGCLRVEMRNAYRLRVGIPLDAPLYARASAFGAA